MSNIFIFIIKAYQKILSPAFAALGTSCRFYPTCSNYALSAFSELPWWKALYLSTKRVIKCGPWHEGGIDRIKGTI